MDPFGLPDDYTLPTEIEIDSLVTKADTLCKGFNALGDGIEAKIGERYQEMVMEKQDSVRGLPMSQGEIAAAMKAADLAAREEAKRYRQGLLKYHEETISEQMRQLNAANEKVQGVLKTYPAVQSYLSAQHLGDPKRTEYSRQIANAGPAEVAMLARRAIGTNDRALAAAVLSKLDSMPKESRPFSAQQFAQRMVGKEYDRYTLAGKKIAHAFQSVINRNRELAKGKADLFEKLKSGLRQHALDLIEGAAE